MDRGAGYFSCLDQGDHSDRADLPSTASSAEGSIIDRFAATVRRFPARLAVQDMTISATYAELAVLVDRIAVATIVTTEGRPGPVAVLLAANATFPAAILGVLAAGRAYVALDADFPGERNGLIISAAGACAIISSSNIVRQMRVYFPPELPIIDVDDLSAAAQTGPCLRPRADDLAAIYYTSGSSGQPKGVAWNHRNLLHWVQAYTDAAQISSADRILLLSSPSVFASFRSIYGALLNGASLHVLPPLGLGLPGLLQEIRARGITLYHSVPSLMRRITESLRTGQRLDTIRLVYLGGDRVQWGDIDLCRRSFSPDVLVYSVFASTEAGQFIHAFVDDALRATTTHPPVGRPAPGCTVTIVGDNGEPVPDGECGGIVVSSRFIALGYWRGTDLQVRPFPSDPANPALRTYKTGDLAVRRLDGLIEFVGRKDHQIKLSGQRIELGEIESALKSCRGVRDAAVVVRRNDSGARQLLVAYCEVEPTATALSPRHLIAMLAQILPLFMVPSSIKILTALPRLSNFKIDREELGRWDQLEREELFTAPTGPLAESSGELQATLLELWRDVLNRRDIGPEDDFFLCGGDSLAAVDLFQRIERKLHYKLPLTILTEAPSVSQLAARLKTGPVAPIGMIGIHSAGNRRPLFAVHGMHSHTLGLLPILRSLGPDQPAYGLQPPAMDWASAGCTALPHIAEHYIREIKSLQPHGPYRLLGTSFGGLVVFEMALQLQRMGEPVEFLAIVDTSPPTCMSEDGVDLWPDQITIWRPQQVGPIERLHVRVAETHWRMTRNYVLDSRSAENIFRGELTFICCTGNPVVASRDRRRLWHRFAPQLRLLPLPIPHDVTYRGSGNTALQNLLRACLEGEPQIASDPARVYDRSYRLDSRDPHRILGSLGDAYHIEQERMQGYLEEVSFNAETIKLSGWAIEPHQRQPAHLIAVFLGDRFLGYGASCEFRPDVAKRLAATSAKYAGFNFTFPRSAAVGVVGRPRLFVLSSDGCAAEIVEAPQQFGSIEDYNIVSQNCFTYGLPKALGPIDLAGAAADTLPEGVIRDVSRQAVEQKIRDLAAMRRHGCDEAPRLLGSIEDYNIVSYDDCIYGLPRALGPIDLAEAAADMLPEGVIRDVSRQAVEQRIRDLAAMRRHEIDEAPRLLGSIEDYNIVSYDDCIYGLPRALGHIDLVATDIAALEGVIQDVSRQAVEQRIRDLAAMDRREIDEAPRLLGSIEDYNIVSYNGCIYGLPRALGPIDLVATDIAALEGVIQDVSREAVEEGIRARLSG